MLVLLASWRLCTKPPVPQQLCPLMAAPCGHLIDRHTHESSSGRTQRNVEHTNNLLR